MLKKTLLLVVGFVVTASASAFADISALANLLAEKRLISYGEAQTLSTESKEEARLKLASGKSELVPAWVQNMTFKGDVRIRTQYDWDTSNQARLRERLRLRLGIETRPVEQIQVGFGFATGALSKDTGKDADPSSTNHTFEYMNKSPLFVDFAYIQYDPIDWLTVMGGKVKGKTQVWNTSDLIWDGDYNPDGLNATAKTELSENTKLSANAGWYTFGEGTKGKMLADLYIIQPVIEFKESNIKIKAGLAYQQFNFAGRTNAGTGLIKNYDFKVINPSVSVDVADVVNSLSLGIYGDYAQNIQKDLPQVGGKDAVTGYLIGAKFGHAKTEKFGTWNINAMYRYLETYAVPECLGDSDAYGGKAGKGYEIIVNFGLTKALSFGIDYYQMTNIDGNSPKSLCQFDFVCKF